jgi:hypothetical protein
LNLLFFIGVAKALDNVLSMDTKTGNNIHASIIIKDVLAKHSIQLEDERAEQHRDMMGGRMMSTDIQLAEIEAMEWSINAEDEFAEHSSFDTNKDGTIEGENEGEGEGNAEGNAEWRQKLETLPTIESIDVTNMTKSFNREIIQGTECKLCPIFF